MMVYKTNKKSQFNYSLLFTFLMIFLGIISGLSGISFLAKLASVISTVFINIFKCISIPILILSLIVTLSNYEKGLMTKVWKKTIFYTISTTLIAALVSCILYLYIKPQSVNLIDEAHQLADNQLSYLTHLTSLVPSNLLTPFLEQQVMAILLIGIVIGIAIQFIPDAQAKNTVINFFKGMYGIFFVITKWVIAILPIGLFGFMATMVVQIQSDINVIGMGEYLFIIIMANLVQGFIILPTWLVINRINPIQSAKQMMPALSVAFFSKSSAATLPITMETAERQLNIDPKISRFILPLCTTLNMNGCAAFIFVTVIYLMQNYGMDISLGTMFCWIFIATIAAIGNAGIPMGCFLLSASLLSTMNVPILLLGIILPFYNIIDMVETALNVWSDSCVANVINKQIVEGQLIPDTAFPEKT